MGVRLSFSSKSRTLSNSNLWKTSFGSKIIVAKLPSPNKSPGGKFQYPLNWFFSYQIVARNNGADKEVSAILAVPFVLLYDVEKRHVPGPAPPNKASGAVRIYKFRRVPGRVECWLIPNVLPMSIGSPELRKPSLLRSR